MGEIRYSKMRGAQSMALIKARPWHFADLSLRRFEYFWFSVPQSQNRHPVGEYVRTLNFAFTSLAGVFGLALALRRHIPGAWLFFWAFLLTPFTYYFITAQARFRHPIEPLITILAIYLFQSAEKRRPKWLGGTV
jgi:hypothetical protein